MSRTTRNILANYAGQAWSAVMGLAFIPVYIEYLGIEAYGLVGLFAVLQAWLSLLDMGMTPALSREMARFSAGAHTTESIWSLLRTVETICFSLAALISLVIWMASAYLASEWLRSQHLPTHVLTEALGLMGVVVALRFCEGVYRGSLLGLQRQVLYNVANAVLATVRHAGAAAILAWLSPTIQAFFLWQTAISIATVAVFALSVRGTLPEPVRVAWFSRQAVERIWSFASGVTGITFFTLLLTQVDKVLLSRLLPLQAFGYYTLAAAVAGVLYMIIGPITQAVYPRMVQLSSPQHEQELTSVYHDSAQSVTVVTAPVVALLCLFSGAVVFAWSGDADLARQTAPALLPLALGTFLNGLMWVPYQCQLAHGWTQLALNVNVGAVLLLVPAILWVVPAYGAVSAAWIWVLLNAGYVLVMIQLMHRKLIRAEKWRWYFADVTLPSLAALAVAAVGHILQPADYAQESRIRLGAMLLIIGAAALIAAAVAADRVRSRLVSMVVARRSGVSSRSLK